MIYSLSFNLKQHTPLVHFQHDQEGATLRATELKPKLDTILFKWFEKRGFDYVPWLIKDKQSFDYKVKIKSKNIIVSEIPDRFPCYFGNMGRATQEKIKFTFSDDPISITIDSNHQQLLNYIKEYIPELFARNNFGTRQTKGFGSFYIHPEDPLFINPQFKYYFTLRNLGGLSDIRTQQEIFKKIDIFCKALRSGINESYRNGIYMKPVIWQYYKEQGVNWEKRKIKKVFYFRKLDEQIQKHDDSFGNQNNPVTYNASEYRMIKDLLGFATNEDAWEANYGFKIVKSHPEIERMRSPFLIKPLFFQNKMSINLISNRTNPGFLNQEFTISNNKKQEFVIKTPEKFKVADLFQFITEESFDIRDLIQRGDSNRNDTADIVEKIFDEIKTNSSHE